MLKAFEDTIKELPETMETVDAAGNKTTLIRLDAENRLRQRVKQLEQSDVQIVEELLDEDLGIVPTYLAHSIQGEKLDYPYDNSSGNLVQTAVLEQDPNFLQGKPTVEDTATDVYGVPTTPANTDSNKQLGGNLILPEKYVPKGALFNKIQQVTNGTVPDLPSFVNTVQNPDKIQNADSVMGRDLAKKDQVKDTDSTHSIGYSEVKTSKEEVHAELFPMRRSKSIENPGLVPILVRKAEQVKDTDSSYSGFANSEFKTGRNQPQVKQQTILPEESSVAEEEQDVVYTNLEKDEIGIAWGAMEFRSKRKLRITVIECL
jgi:hypothetical protein